MSDFSQKDDKLSAYILGKVQTLRPKLLDLTKRNPLLATRLSARSNSLIRIINTTPEYVFSILTGPNEKSMRIMPLPHLHAELADEQTEIFINALKEAQATDEVYKSEMAEIEDGDEQEIIIERALKDRIRKSLGLGERQQKDNLSVSQHAKNHNISPDFDLPLVDECEKININYDILQTLLLPEDLPRRVKGLLGKANTWEQETGINVLHIAFGFLEWSERNDVKGSFAPLILIPVKIELRKTAQGPEFWLHSTGDVAESNFVLNELMAREFDMKLPQFDPEAPLNQYFSDIEKAIKPNDKWKVRRQIIIGVFPSASIAMYMDLDLARHDFQDNNIIKDLLGGVTSSGESPYAEDYDIDLPEMEMQVPHLVMDADSSQVSTIIDMAQGKNIAVEGPPGTGKSQTIVNAIATALHSGKKVLFVAEKMAALEVVKSRLESVGLGEFILPLQAKRSSREEVINSIRARVELSNLQNPLHYENKIREFHETRNRLDDYIKIISSKFGNSGIKIYDIIGKALFYKDILASLENALLDKDIEDVESYTFEQIENLKKMATILVDARNGANSNKGFWKFLNISYLDPFAQDSILNTSKNLASLLFELKHKFDHLENFKFTGELSISDIEILKDNVSQLEVYNEFLNIDFIKEIIKSNLNCEFINFFKNYELYCQKIIYLKNNIYDIEIKNLDGILTKFVNFFESINLDRIDSENIENQIAIVSQSIAIKENILNSIDILKKEFTKADEIGFETLAKAYRFISQTPNEAFALRSEVISGDSERIEMERICREGIGLCERKVNLEQFVNLDVALDKGMLATILSTFKSSGFFSFLSPSYHRAKKYYLSISCRKKFVKEDAISDIQLLLSWVNDKENFDNNVNAPSLFGLHFNSIATNFELFIKILDYYKNVKSNFLNYNDKDFRDFLISSGIDSLALIPYIPDDMITKKHFELPGIIKYEKEYLEKLKKCKKIAEKLHKLLINDKELSIDKLKKFVNEISLYNKLKNFINHNIQIQEIIDQHFNDWRSNYNMLETPVSIINLLTSKENFTNPLLQVYGTSSLIDLKDYLVQLIADTKVVAGKLEDLSSQTGIKFNMPDDYGNILKSAQFFEQAGDDKEGLNAWSIFVSQRNRYADLGYKWILDGLDEDNFNNLAIISEALVYRSMVRHIYNRYGTKLNGYHRQELDHLHAEIGRLDKEIISLSRQYIRAKLVRDANPPVGNGSGAPKNKTEQSLIDHEINKKQRFISPRDLVRRAKNALLELKPCWMMSPLAVAQYLEHGNLDFDICILDEASQMPPENAIGALVRSKQAMIVGDTNQLPPTNFFKKNFFEEDNENEDQNILEESILEMANIAFRPARRLKWHYRSRHSGLIQFSNHHIYDDDLVVFPSPSESRKDMGVSLVTVKGNYKSGVNPNEATRIVEATLEFMKEHPGRSLGIVALNQKQSDLIREEFESAMLNDMRAAAYVDDWNEKNDGLESFFIKNLENVQGDERDAIFISTVYGPETEGGKVMQRFGPISGVGGKRRLNVLFTRAKQQIITFSSMNSADILAAEEKNPGAFMLKCWLEYSASGICQDNSSKNHEADSDFELYVMNQIKSMGCETVPQVGAAGYRIDIGVKHPDWPYGYILGVECDGAAYHSSKSARERDRLREDVLKGLGWKLHRIWSTSWFGDPLGEAEKLRMIIENRIKELKKGKNYF